ncbi:dipeptidase [Intestinimonas butyriciproducens]|uniref:dipeptidase n=1 Tax=Intestinimonas butyriciproducens TaxID=1297617 RepID=UPI001959E1A4|nr:dipeptidase [Intestinimonas butyriciproducens]MBM6918402.1 membrane dipeptidase [Intestinimonas butyriciproducens]
MEMRFIDTHCDTMGECIARSEGKVTLQNNPGHINMEKLIRGGAMAEFFAIFIPTHDSGAGKGVTLPPYDYFQFVYKAYLKELEANKDVLAPACNYDDIMANKAAGKVSSVLTVEDGVPLEGKMERLEEFYQKGVRLISFTWNYENSLGFPNSKDPEIMNRGLKQFGLDCIERMNEMGMLVDVSHLSDGGFWDVVKHSKKPFIASHSCCRALCNHTRNLTDEMLHALGEKGGVVGINFASQFLNEGAEYTDIQSVVRHMLHIRDKAGLDALGFGSDFDGITSTLEFKDYTGLPLIVDALKPHFTDDEIDKICSGNMLRLIRDTLK